MDFDTNIHFYVSMPVRHVSVPFQSLHSSSHHHNAYHNDVDDRMFSSPVVRQDCTPFYTMDYVVQLDLYPCVVSFHHYPRIPHLTIDHIQYVSYNLIISDMPH